MPALRLLRLEVTAVLALAVGTWAAIAPPAGAADVSIPLPAGTACPGFDVLLEITNTPQRVFKQFTDRNGQVVRTVESGKGNDLTFTNVNSGTTVHLKSKGSIIRATPSATAETRHVVNNGHNIIILFPTDSPAGPSTILYTGRVVYDVAPGEVFTLSSVTGRTRDICVELSA